MGALVKTLYETDYLEWTARTAQLIREGRLDEIDLETLAAEIDDLGRNLQSAVKSQLRRMLMHLVKQRIHPERDGASWRASIASAQAELLDHIADSASLRRFARTVLDDVYHDAVRIGLLETGIEEHAADLDLPARCPYTLDQLLAKDVSALWRK